jgi:hypothetical protein
MGGQGVLLGCCEYCNEHSGYVKGGEFLNQISNYQFIRKDSAAWSLLTIQNTSEYPTFFIIHTRYLFQYEAEALPTTLYT